MVVIKDALSVYVVLTTFIPMLMDTGGNAGGQASVTVIRGLSLREIAGSKPSFLAAIGSILPTTLAKNTAMNSVRHTTADTIRLTLSISISLRKLAAANVMPHRKRRILKRWRLSCPAISLI